MDNNRPVFKGLTLTNIFVFIGILIGGYIYLFVDPDVEEQFRSDLQKNPTETLKQLFSPNSPSALPQSSDINLFKNIQAVNGFWFSIPKNWDYYVHDYGKNDRHPDHGRAAELIKTCCFLSGLIKVKTNYNNLNQNIWRPNSLYYYTQFNQEIPDFVVDVSSYMEKKMKIIECYSSQFFNPKSKEPETIISKKSFLDSIIYRASDLGRIINVKYAEGFKSERLFSVDDLFNLK